MPRRRNRRVAQDAAAERSATTIGMSEVSEHGAATGVHRRHWRVRALVGLVALALLATVWLIGSETSLPTMADWLERADRWHASPLAPVIVLVAFVIGGLVVFPVNLLIAATIVVLGPVVGTACALGGSVLSAAAVHEIGRLLPATVFARVAGDRGMRLRRRVVGHGLIAVALVRVVPIAPYSIVSLVAGAARIRRLPYLVGTALGMAPGIVLYALFVDRARAALLNPHPLAWLGVGVVLLAIIAVGVFVRARAGAPADRA
jgi:phospholipase D1/2